MSELSNVVNLKKYSLDDLNSKASSELISSCHSQLDSDGLCLLPNFVTAAFIDEIISEVKEQEMKLFYTEHWRTPFGTGSIKGKKNVVQTRASMRSFGYDLLKPDSKLRLLYESDIFLAFLRKILKNDKLFKCIDPMISCLITICREGDELGWHYDPNDGVVTLLLQKSTNGGEFEFVPDVASPGIEPTKKELSILDNQDEDIISISQNPGTLSLFNGSNSLHRVAPVDKNSERIMAVLSYSNEPDYMFSSSIRNRFLGRSS